MSVLTSFLCQAQAMDQNFQNGVEHTQRLQRLSLREDRL
jgi:hypothetical protein